jgi:hypothetical protein
VSHVTEIKVKILDLDALARAAKRCGLEVRRKQNYKWYGRHVGDYPMPKGMTQDDLGKCHMALGVIGNNEAYEVGVVADKSHNGEYMLVWDFWGGGYGLEKSVGKDACKLRQAYALEVVIGKAQSLVDAGWEIREVQQPNGHVQIEITRDGSSTTAGTSGGGSDLW